MEIALFEPKQNKEEIKPILALEETLELRSLPIAIQKAKNYEEIVDTFSSHQVVIRKGKILNTPEFMSFKRIYSEHWSMVSAALNLGEEIFGKLGTALVYLDGKKLAEMAKDELRSLKQDEILSCVTNSNSVIPFLENPHIKFKTPLGKDLACVKIQSAWKGYKAYVAYHQLKILIEKANVIKKTFKNYLVRKNTLMD